MTNRLTRPARDAARVPGWTLRAVRELPARDRWDLLRYLIVIGWAVTFIIYTPASLIPFLAGPTTLVLMLLAILGCIVGIIGRVINQHLVLELPGAVLAALTILFYLFVNVVLAFAVTTDRAALCWIIAVALSFPLERAVGLGRRLWVVLTTPEDKL